MIEHTPLIEIESNSSKYDVVFFSNGEYVISKDNRTIEVWRVRDGEQMARMETEQWIYGPVVSPDGRWIAAGIQGDSMVYVWDGTTYERAFMLQNDEYASSLDFSPDSTRLVTSYSPGIVVVWDVTTRKRVLGPLEHEGHVREVKYSPQGDRIAVAASALVLIRDSHDGRLLMNIPVASPNIVWLKDQLLIMSEDEIRQVEASSGATIMERQVPAYSGYTLAVSQHVEFFAYSVWRTVSLWDESMHYQLDLVRRSGDLNSMTISPDGRFLAIVESFRKIVIYNISKTAHVPFIDLPEAGLKYWELDQLVRVDESLTRNIMTSSGRLNHNAYASRSLIRAQLGHRDAAIDDAEKSINTQPSMIGYIAKSVALIGGENKENVHPVYDLASRHAPFVGPDILLLTKAVVLFMAGDHNEAMLRVDYLISTLHLNSICYVILAYMHLHLGKLHMDKNYYDSAIQSCERARSLMRPCTWPLLRTITFISGWKFDGLGIIIRQHLCDALYAAGRVKDASECFIEMVNLFDKETYVRASVFTWVSDVIHRFEPSPEANWALDLAVRCAKKAVGFGDIAGDGLRHDDAIVHYSAALSLGIPVPQDILIKRSKARAAVGLWQDALNDANEVTNLDPSLPWGYERKYVALSVGERHEEKSDAFATMLSRMAQSNDPEIRERGDKYLKTQETIRGVIQDIIHNLPPVLISIISGRLCDRSEQVLAFELSPSYAELVSTMTTQMDVQHIRREVAEYYRYATFSHKNEANEPLFDEVVNMSIYRLGESPTHEKLRKFCNIVQDAGFHWAWSNTCCVDSSDRMAVQEAVTSMYRWYQESALTVIYLLDVDSPSQQGDLAKSIWNSRAWIFQEYHASKVVRFYNNDWTLYRNLDILNHKELPEIASEIEEATGVSYSALKDLSPDLGNIRSKLYLASRRETTLVEDVAYSLFGIFSLSLPVVYGEGDKALGHLLSQLVTKSGDTNILAWTGATGAFNSCLPKNITVFRDLIPSHVRPIVEENMVDEVADDLRASSLNIAFLTKLVDRLKELPRPLFMGQELKLPCLTFKLGPVSASDTNPDHIFNIQAPALGDIEIRSEEDLSRFESLYLVHPWIDYLLDRSPGRRLQTHDEESEYERSEEEVLAFPSRSNVPLGALVQERASRLVARLKQFRRPRPRSRSESPPPTQLAPAVPAVSSQGNRQMKVVRFAARLQQPFDALLMAPNDYDKGKYKRVAAECRITVRMGEITAPVLKQLVEGVQVLDVL